MKKFKGTKKMFAVEYAGFFCIQDGPYYENENVLNFDEDLMNNLFNNAISEETVRANAKLIAAAPELLEACIEFVRKCDCGEARSKRSYKQMSEAINKALD